MQRKPVRYIFPLVLVFLPIISGEQCAAYEPAPAVDFEIPAYRAPVGLVWQHDHVYVANSKTGSVTKVNLKAGEVAGEWKVAGSLSGIAAWRNQLLLLDDQKHLLIQAGLSPDSSRFELIKSLELPHYPVDIAVSGDDTLIAVSSLWSRTLTLFEGPETGISLRKQIPVPFAPRRILFLPDDRILVADSFGGQLAVIDPHSERIVSHQSVFGHNIRGLAINHKQGSVHVSLQSLDSEAFTSYEPVFWGVLMQNSLHSVPFRELMSETEVTEFPPSAQSVYQQFSETSHHRYPLGTPSIGSGDPGAVAVTDNDVTLVLLSGVNQIAVRTANHLPFERLKTGRRPEAICLDDSQEFAIIANRFDDTISVISLSGEFPVAEKKVALGRQRQLTSVEQGEQVFYDASISLDGWFSCHSCHTDGHTNGMNADTFGDEHKGTPRKVASLLGTGSSGPWAWNGTKTSLEDQIRTSLIVSMQSQIAPEDLPVQSLADYLRSLPPAPSILSARQSLTAKNTAFAMHIFTEAGCRNCHSGEAMTSDAVLDVGIHDLTGQTHFNPPSLRGVSQRAPYFHDGRAATLTDVLKSSHHAPDSPLLDEQIRHLSQLLESF